jgi:DNA polymerase-3 subunit beta
MLRRVSIAASREEGRYQLNGVFLEVDGEKLTMTATDGKRLTNDTMRVENETECRASGIVPNPAVEVLLKVLASGDEKFHFVLQPTQIQVSFTHGQISAKLVEGAYPDYQSAIPAEKRSRVSIRRADLLAAVRSASQVTDRETQTLTFKFNGDGATIESHAKDIGDSQIKVPITLEGEPLEIRFSPVYFLDALRTITEEQVRMEFCGNNRAGTIRGGLHYRHLLMPLVVG